MTNAFIAQAIRKYLGIKKNIREPTPEDADPTGKKAKPGLAAGSAGVADEGTKNRSKNGDGS